MEHKLSAPGAFILYSPFKLTLIKTEEIYTKKKKKEYMMYHAKILWHIAVRYHIVPDDACITSSSLRWVSCNAAQCLHRQKLRMYNTQAVPTLVFAKHFSVRYQRLSHHSLPASSFVFP